MGRPTSVRELTARGKNFKLHPVELLKVSTPNIGKGFDIDPPRFVHISTPAALVAYDVSMHLPKLDKPMTGVRVVFHPDPNTPGGGRGYGAIAPDPLLHKGPPPTGRGTFIVTAFSASADPVAGDNVNLNHLLGISQVTADSWLPSWRPEGVIDTRGDDGWSPADTRWPRASDRHIRQTGRHSDHALHDNPAELRPRRQHCRRSLRISGHDRRR